MAAIPTDENTERTTYTPAKPKVKSWWCHPCSVEVYSLRCKYCGKSEAEES